MATEIITSQPFALDPQKADEPKALAAFEQTTIDNLRAIQHKDATGNIIGEIDALTTIAHTLHTDRHQQSSPISPTQPVQDGNALSTPFDPLKKQLTVDTSVGP